MHGEAEAIVLKLGTCDAFIALAEGLEALLERGQEGLGDRVSHRGAIRAVDVKAVTAGVVCKRQPTMRDGGVSDVKAMLRPCPTNQMLIPYIAGGA